jgi:hypothetical protein
MLKQLPDKVLSAFAALDGQTEFQTIISWLDESLVDLNFGMSLTKDDVNLRWQQGAAQVLRELVEKARNAKATHYSRQKRQ